MCKLYKLKIESIMGKIFLRALFILILPVNSEIEDCYIRVAAIKDFTSIKQSLSALASLFFFYLHIL